MKRRYSVQVKEGDHYKPIMSYEELNHAKWRASVLMGDPKYSEVIVQDLDSKLRIVTVTRQPDGSISTIWEMAPEYLVKPPTEGPADV